MLVLGVDEVGRGAVAGPLVVGAVVLERKIPGLKDSKLLTRAQREQFAALINEQALFCGLGRSTPAEIDCYGITRASRLAAERALATFDLKVARTILDGNYNYLPSRLNAETLIGGDNLVCEISAASIVAKVARDNYMIALANAFSGFGFETNVGYCTPGHVAALVTRGYTDHHRRTFEPIKSLYPRNSAGATLGPAHAITIAR